MAYSQRGCTLQRGDKQKIHCLCLLLVVSVATGCTDTFLIAQPCTEKQCHLWLQIPASARRPQEFSTFQEQWETLPDKWKSSVRDSLICLLILLHFILIILRTPKIHNIQLSNFLSFPQAKPVATPASYLN